MPVYSFIVRKATENDAKNIQLIIQEAFKKYIKDANLKDTIEALEESTKEIIHAINTQKVFIASINGTPVGTIRFEIDENNQAHISRFGVRLDYHNIGIGKSLMNLIDAELIEKKINTAYLYTASKYTDLVKFYYGRGFYVESTSKDRGYIRAKLVKNY